jgi:hypothetical protein
MRGAAPKIPDSIQQNKILAVVMFGDPGLRRLSKELPAPLQSRLFENCAPGDPVSSAYYPEKTDHLFLNPSEQLAPLLLELYNAISVKMHTLTSSSFRCAPREIPSART